MHKAKILIVEDDRIMAEDLKFRVETAGFSVVGIAASSDRAFDIVEAIRPDLALMDIQIKGKLNGIQTAQILKDKYDIPFIYLTAFADRETLDQVKITTPHGFILKPFDTNELTGVIETALHKIKIEKILKESEAKYRELYESISDAIVTINLDSQIVSCNDIFCEMLGYSREELQELSYYDITPDKWHNDIKTIHWPQVLKRGHTDVYENEFVAKNGSVIPVELKVFLIRDSNGNPFQIWALIRNITEKKENEARLEQEQSFRDVVMQMATRFINLPLKEIPLRLADVLRHIGKALDCAYCGLYSNNTDCSKIELVAQFENMVHAAGFKNPGIEYIHQLCNDNREQLIEGRLTIINSKGDPSNDMPEVETLLLPFIQKSDLKGGLVIQSDPSIKSWSREEYDLLTVVAEMINNVLFRVESESRIVESENRFRNLFNNSSDAILILDGHEIIDCNNKAQTMFRCLTEEISGSGLAVFSPDTQPTGKDSGVLVQYINRVFQEDVHLNFEWQLLRADGSVFDAEVSMNCIQMDEGSYIQAIIRDISKRKKVEKALLDSEERFRSLADMLPQPVYETDLEGLLTYANQAAFNMFEYDSDDFAKGLYTYDIIAVPDVERAMANFKKLIMGQGKDHYEYIAMCKNGRKFSILIYANLIVVGDRPVGTRGVVMDITALRQAEKALKQSEEKYRQLVELAQDGIVIVTDDCIQYANKPVCTMLGVDHRNLIGKKVKSFILNEFHEKLESHMAIQLQVDDSPSIIEVNLKRSGGQILPVEINMGPVFFQDTPSILIYIRDISERVKAQDAMRTAQQAHHLATLGTLAAGISHEINQPLMALKVKVDSMLYWGEESPDVLQKNILRNLSFISTEADKIDKIIRHMRSLIRMEKVYPSPVDINMAIERSTQLIRQRMAAHGIRLEKRLSKKLPQVNTHATSIEQVVVNLLSNAMYALDRTDSEDKCICIQTRKVREFCHIEVSDNGPGIPEKIMPRIFDPLFTTRGSGESMGLGLSIVQYLLMKIDGDVKVTNQVDGGAKFTVVLPLV